ncbi:MAG TPA: glucoamylase family protein [Candidatus Wallbacteria bacterium]|nr:glucoamylase family protein [Candidatus Wallbacteria bacterium]
MKKFVTPVCAVLFILFCFGFCFAETSKSDAKFIEMVQKKTLNYFLKCMNPENGLTMDKAPNFGSPDYSYSPSTTAGVGFGLASLAVGAERGWVEKDYAKRVTLAALKYFYEKMEHVNGFFYHFTDMATGKRAWNCEISSIDTALFIAGAIFCGEYYNDAQIKKYASLLYYRVNWKWMTNGGKYISMGWKPEDGFINCYWSEYCESMILYILAIGSPTYPVGAGSWHDINRPYGEYASYGHIYCSSLFTHQYSHIWIDFSNKNDGYADYFYNSKMATLANRQFCIDSAREYPTFADGCFGLTACIGPDGYVAYGSAPAVAVNDGTLAPTAAGGSIIFTPAESIKTLRRIYEKYGDKMWGEYGFSDSFNAGRNWFAKDAYAINQGPIILMIENFRSGLVQKVFMKNRCVTEAMRLVGFHESYGFKHDMTKLKTHRNKVYMLGERPAHVSAKVAESFGPDDAGFDSSIWKINPDSTIILNEKFMQSGSNNQPGYSVFTDICDNSKYLFIRCRVNDIELVSKKTFAELHLDDDIEIYLDPENDKFVWGGKKDFQIVVSPENDLSGIRISDASFKGAKAKFVASRFRRFDSGYEFILTIPKNEFLIRPGVCGFSIAAHNLDEKLQSECKFNSFFAEPGIWLGNLKLSN